MSQFSVTVMDHFESPRNQGRLDRADAVGLSGVPGQGRYLSLAVRVERGVIVESRFQCHGCGATIACGSMLTTLIEGRLLEFCRTINAETLLNELDGLPPHKRHCAGMAVGALQQVLNSVSQSASVEVRDDLCA